MSDQAIAQRVDLDKKDKGELQAIVTALGGKASSRMKKADLIDTILELSGVTAAAEASDSSADAEGAAVQAADAPGPDVESGAEASTESADDGEQPSPDSESATAAADSSSSSDTRSGDPSGRNGSSGGGDNGRQEKPVTSDAAANEGGSSRRRRGRRRAEEPPAEWETELADNDGSKKNQGGSQGGKGKNQQDQKQGRNQQDQNQNQGRNPQDQNSDDEVESGNRRRRRRGRGRDRDDNIEPVSQEPVAVSGCLDLRDDGYGFLRVAGLLATKDDVYVPVKMVRQHGLRKGDVITGTARPANRNEKNPALQTLDTVNGDEPEASVGRPEFEKLTPLFPDERIRLERARQPVDLTARIVDLIAPIGKGQRGLIVSPPKAGKTTIVKEIVTSIEENHPEIELIVLLVDERPEEVTDMERHLKRGEVVASTFDRPTEEHCTVAELTIERAKRLVELGKDVVIVLDGITRLARAYNLSASGTGRVMSGGVDAGALYPPKKFLGAARNLEEGGSLTILATALVETGSRMDEVIFEEFKGTGNMELRLDRGLAERLVFPAIDALGSSTRRDELLMDGKEHVLSTKLRGVLTGMAAAEDGSAAAAMNLLMDRLKTFKTNEEFLNEIARSG